LVHDTFCAHLLALIVWIDPPPADLPALAAEAGDAIRRIAARREDT
jgi:hypothetical protein